MERRNSSVIHKKTRKSSSTESKSSLEYGNNEEQVRGKLLGREGGYSGTERSGKTREKETHEPEKSGDASKEQSHDMEYDPKLGEYRVGEGGGVYTEVGGYLQKGVEEEGNGYSSGGISSIDTDYESRKEEEEEKRKRRYLERMRSSVLFDDQRSSKELSKIIRHDKSNIRESITGSFMEPGRRDVTQESSYEINSMKVCFFSVCLF
ncbi:hypothetical protein AX774_g2649 [Zancudomyces culisetae]|uniref:Uncharacterized protein n=1 Tax=Zancudomyces culisetae TaxID=1213189 RepID=A0A1R1PSD7_ZANCU|nr:hypothetical protein AX774_g2649 [Zancudomyces culisetae]|eukprot:OMH83839.1 hypothetical protein AX774_g2649 [Zancudomyces culisetae]